jgi:gamma-glutamylputrescine oxidase
MSRRLAAVFPALKDVAIDRCWEGEVAVTRAMLPRIGRVGRNMWIAHGYCGVGLALAYLAGSMISEAIAGRGSALDSFARIPHKQWPVGLMELPTKAWVAMSTWARDLV